MCHVCIPSSIMAIEQDLDHDLQRVLTRDFEDAYNIDRTQCYGQALELCHFCVAKDLPMKPVLFAKLADAFSFHDVFLDIHGAPDVPHEDIVTREKAYRLACHPERVFYEFCAYIVTTAHDFGFVQIQEVLDQVVVPLEQRLHEDLGAVDFNDVVSFVDTFLIQETSHNRQTSMMLLYAANTIHLILRCLADPTTREVYEDMRDHVDSFLACFGIVETYRCVGGECSGADPCTTRPTLSSLITSTRVVNFDDPEHHGPYFMCRHIAARFLCARRAARVIQRNWRKYRRFVRRNGARALHMINKYVCTIPIELVQDILKMLLYTHA